MGRRGRWLAALLLLALVLALPLLLNLNIFLGGVHRALERQLGRQVEMASLTARLLPRPGVVGRGVVVYEGEEFGAEPLLYAEEIQCQLSLRSLWTLRLEFSRIHFVRPSLNLVRNARRAWNVGSFLLNREGARAPQATAGTVPVISASDARVNFKFGLDKQPFALAASRVWLEPLSDGRWRFALRALPMRTDRRLSEVGELVLEGEVGRGPEFSALPFKLQVNLARGSLAQLWTLLTGHEPPFRAAASLAATVEGTPAEWGAQGTLSLAELRRWDLLAPPRAPVWNTSFRIAIRSRDSTVLVEELTVRGRESEIKVTGSVVKPLGPRRYDLQVRSDNLLFNELLAQLAGFRVGVADDAPLEGAARLQLLLRGPVQEWRGELVAPASVKLQVPGVSPPVEVSGLELRLARGRLELLPLTLRFSPTHALQVRGELEALSPAYPFRLLLQSPAISLDPLRRATEIFGWSLFGATRWRGEAAVNLEWRGELSGEEALRWQGEVSLREAAFHPPELNHAVDLPPARLVWKGQGFEVRPLRLRLGDNPFTVSLNRQGRTGRWNLTLEAPRMSLDDLDEILNPARLSLLSRLVRPAPRREPHWRQLDVAGTAKIGELVAGPLRFQQVEARGEWQSGWLELPQLRFRVHGGRFDGRLQVDLRGDTPRYRLSGNLKQLQLGGFLADTTRLGDLYSGLVGADLALETAGDRPRELLRRLQGRIAGVLQDGTINHINLLDALAAAAGENPAGESSTLPTSLQSLAGEFLLADERVQFDGVRMITSRASFELSGSVDFTGRLDLRLRGEPLRVAGRPAAPLATEALRYSYRLTGTLREPQVTLGERLPEAAPVGR